QERGDPPARAVRMGGEQRPLAALAEELEMRRGGFVDVVAARALGSEIARRVKSEIDGPVALGFAEDDRAMDRALVDLLSPLVARKIERVGLQRTIAPGRLAGGVLALREVILDILETLVAGCRRSRIDRYDIVRTEMVEQCRQPLLEQRQPMLHSREPSPVADRLVERVLRCMGSERLAIPAAEPLDGFVVEQRL